MDRLVIGLLAGSAIFAALLLSELSSVVDLPAVLPSATQTEASPTPVAQRPRVDELIQTALAQPLFSATRRPSDQAVGDRSPDPELPNMRLTGIVIEPERHLAIFAVPGGKPLARGEGETINQWRLENIAPNQVSLSGPTGITILEPKFDPNLVRPKQAPQPAAQPPQPAAVGARLGAPRPAGPPPGAAAMPPNRALTPAARPAARPNPARPQ